MHQMNPCGRAIHIGLVIGAAVLVAACQEPGHQDMTGKSAVASTQVQPVASPAPAPVALVTYAPSAAPTKLLSSCNLEYVDVIPLGSSQSVTLKNGQLKAFKGWVDGSGLAQPSYWLRLDDPTANRYLQMPVALTIPRPDVRAVEASAALVSGFNVNVPVNTLPVGSYHVYLAVESGNTVHVCDNGRHIEVVP